MRGVRATLVTIAASIAFAACGLDARGLAEPATVDEASPVPASADASVGADATVDANETGAACTAPLPSTTTTCPTSCNNCNGGSCNFVCGQDACTGKTLTCPPGIPCTFTCSGHNACEDAILQCNGTHTCSISCTGEDACQRADIRCGAGACAIACGVGAEACVDTKMHCSTGACTATCTGGTKPSLVTPATACFSKGC